MELNRHRGNFGRQKGGERRNVDLRSEKAQSAKKAEGKHPEKRKETRTSSLP